MIGYVLRKNANINNMKGIFLILGGFGIELFLARLRYVQVINNIELKYSLIGPYSPLVVIASILIFVGFSKLDIKANVRHISSLTFMIYLLHAAVWDVMQLLIRKTFIKSIDARVGMILSTIIVFVICIYLAKCYLFLWNKINGKYKLEDKLCKVFRL